MSKVNVGANVGTSRPGGKDVVKGTIELRTDRLLLRRLRPEDADIFHRELGCNPAITRYTGWNPYTSPESAAAKVAEGIRDYEKEGCYSWAIQCGDDVIGTIGAYGYDPDNSSIEIGYSIFQSAWGNGYASEAVTAVVNYLLNTEHIHRIHAWSHAENLASCRVLEKAGLKQEGLLRDAMKNPDGSFADQRIFGIAQNICSTDQRPAVLKMEIIKPDEVKCLQKCYQALAEYTNELFGGFPTRFQIPDSDAFEEYKRYLEKGRICRSGTALKEPTVGRSSRNCADMPTM